MALSRHTISQALQEKHPKVYHCIRETKVILRLIRSHLPGGIEKRNFLQDWLMHYSRGRILAGPFKGMRYGWASVGSVLTPKILGTYERETAPFMEKILSSAYDSIIVVGCAEGYYAVGLARALPNARVHAFDIEKKAQTFTRLAARLNHVADRVHVGAECDFATFERLHQGRTLVVCDIEGAELQLLNPERAPSLLRSDILVEIHDGTKSNQIKDALRSRFQGRRFEIVKFTERTEADCPLPPLPGVGPAERIRLVQENRQVGIEWALIS